MVDVSEAMEGQFLTADAVKQSKSSIAIITNGGDYQIVEFNGRKSRRLSLEVSLDGNIKTWRPNRDSVKNLAGSWGIESKYWIGKKAYLSIYIAGGRESILAVPYKKQTTPETPDVDDLPSIVVDEIQEELPDEEL